MKEVKNGEFDGDSLKIYVSHMSNISKIYELDQLRQRNFLALQTNKRLKPDQIS